MLYYYTSYTRDNVDSSGSIILKVILINYKLIANSLGLVLDSKLAIDLVV